MSKKLFRFNSLQIQLTLILLVTLEALSQTFVRTYGNKDLAAIVYIIAGLLIGFLPLLKGVPHITKASESKPLSRIIFRLMPFLIAFFIAFFGWQAIQERALDYKYADMLPVIEVMGQRWLNGEAVYAIIPEIWKGMQPIYLPAMWLPYVSAIFFGLDLRVVNLLFILVAILLALDVFNSRRLVDWSRWLIYIPIGVLLSYIFLYYSSLVSISEEPIVVGFYSLLAYGLIKNKPYLIAVALACCLLSRYTLLFWSVAYILYTFWNGEKSTALKIVLGGGAFGLLLIFISQGIYQIELFYSLKDSYLETLTNPEEKWGMLNIISKNVGLARFVAYEHLPYMHQALIWGSLVLPFILYGWYHWRLRSWVAPGLFALCSLKLCLVYFFNMNTMPYSYLFYVGSFLSLVLVGHYGKSQLQ